MVCILRHCSKECFVVLHSCLVLVQIIIDVAQLFLHTIVARLNLLYTLERFNCHSGVHVFVNVCILLQCGDICRVNA